jgi:hypothetical protein
MWSIGCTIGLIGVIWITIDDRDYGLTALALFLGGPVAIIIGALPWMFLEDASSPNLATLKKGEWVCTNSHTVVTGVPISTGKTTTIMPQSHKVCDSYTRL